MGKKILIIDDSSTIRQQVRFTLERNGYEVIEATNGRDGFEVIRKTSDVVMVIVDVNMPFMNGIEFTSKTKKTINPNLPIVILTTEDSADAIEQAKAAGACAYMIKPFKPAHLEAIAKKLIGAS